MATTGTGGASHHGSRGGGKPPVFEPEIKVFVGEIQQASEFIVPIEIRTVKGKKIFPNAQITIKKGVAAIGNGTTDASGIFIFDYKEDLKSAGKTINLRFQIVGETAEASASIVFPAIEKTVKPTKVSDDPETITITRHHDGAGNFILYIRVTKTGGVGLKTPVAIFSEGILHNETTDKNGNLTFCAIRNLDEGERLEVSATVSGIQDPARITLRHPRAQVDQSPAFTSEWWLGTNNGRAFIFLCAMAVLWLFAFIIGWGDPLFNPPQTELSQQQLTYNEVVTGIDGAKAIAPEVSRGNWQKIFWLIAGLWSVFALIYAPLALRDEVAEGMREAFERLLNRPYVQAGDPLAQRLMAWCGAQGFARRSPEPGLATPPPASAATTTTTTTAGEAEQATKKDVSFWKLLRSDLLSDMLVEVLPSVLGRVFR